MLSRGSGRGGTWAVVGVLVGLPILFATHPERTLAETALDMVFIVVALAVHVVIHEAAHALAALATGMGVPEVELGRGTPLLRLRLGSTTVKISGFHSGATHLEPRSEGLLRTRLLVVTAAGPVANLAVAAVTFWLLDPPLSGESFGVSMIIAGVLLGVVNLVPFRARRASGSLQTDGAAMLALLVDRRAGEHLAAAGRLDAAQRQYIAGGTVAPSPVAPFDRTDPVMLGIEGTRRIFTGEYAEAVTLLREAVAMPHDEEVRALSLNNLAWALLLGQPEGWLEEAERASAEAEALSPEMEAALSTRGCILVHCGDHADARRLLLEAVRGEGAAPHEWVLLHSHLLRAELGVGNLYGARAALLAMADHGAGPEELVAARALLRDAEVDNALTNLVSADGTIQWPDTADNRELARHVAEMRSALVAFVAEAGEDPRREAVRVALGG